MTANVKSGLVDLEDEYDLVVVGAGLSGVCSMRPMRTHAGACCRRALISDPKRAGFVMAQQAATRLGLKSLIIDKRDHIGAS